jgi:hypothetical protein
MWKRLKGNLKGGKRVEMKKYFVNLSGKELAKRREGKIDNLLSSAPNQAFIDHFNQLRTFTKANNENVFMYVVIGLFEKFQQNITFVQEVSALNKKEFAKLAGVSHNLFYNSKQQYIINLRLHTFLKVYSLFLVYLPSLDFCDMFTLDFRTTFPFLIEQQEENRRKLGKKPLKKAKK